DRVLLALNAEAEALNDPPPLTIRFARPEAKGPPPGGAAPSPALPALTAETSASPEWLELQKKLNQQRARTGRIRVPTRDEVLNRLGDKHPAAWQSGIIWSRVAYGYQPELTDAWFDCATGFRQDSNMDRIFQNSI